MGVQTLSVNGGSVLQTRRREGPETFRDAL